MYYAYFIETMLCRIRYYLEYAINSSKYFLSVMNDLTKEAHTFIDELTKWIRHSFQNGRPENYHQDTRRVNYGFSFINESLYRTWLNITKIGTRFFGRNAVQDRFNNWSQLLERMNNKENSL